MTKTPGSLTECFYYDRQNNEFFSILAIDYFMLDENFNISEDASVSYSTENLKILLDRMKRIEADSNDIISIPFADTQKNIQNQIDTFLNLNTIDIMTVTIWEPEDASITFQVGQSDKQPKNKPWWKFW